MTDEIDDVIASKVIAKRLDIRNAYDFEIGLRLEKVRG